MREIKLQFWDSESSEMIQLGTNSDFEVFFSKEGEMEIYAVFEGSDGGWEHHKREGAIRQFTGLLDKNGKEIYDGDIVNDIGIIKIISSSKRYPGAFWCTDDSNIENYGCGDYTELLGYSNKDFLIIIGNIYENSGLIK